MALNLTSRQARRSVLLGITAASLVLSGCQLIRRGPDRPLPPAPRPVPAPVVPVEGERNKVAVIVPLTGPDGGVGTSISNAANLALADSGEKSLQITIYNSAGPGGAKGAAQRAIAEGNGLILGPLLAEDVSAATPITREAGIPMIAFSNDESVAGKGVFIMGFTPNQSIGRVVEFAKERGVARYAALVASGLYGQRAAQALLEAARRNGGRVATVETFNRTPAAAATAARKLKAKGGYDAVLVGDSGRIAATIAPVIGAGPRIIGTELWANDKTMGKTPALRGAWYAAAPDAQFQRMVTRYRARYGKTPYRLGSLGYDAVLLAVRSSREWPIGGPFPARTLIDREGFSGVDGNFRFGRDGVAERLLEVRQVTPTGTIVVSPAERAF